MNIDPKYQFRKFNKSEIPKIPVYYNNIRFIDNNFWKEVKFIRDSKTIVKEKDGTKTWFKVVQIMKMIIGNQNEKEKTIES